MRKIVRLLAVILLVSLFASCSGKQEVIITPTAAPESAAPTPSPSATPAPTPTPTPAPTPTPTPAPTPEPTPEPTPTPGPLNPLTGLPIEEEKISRRPAAIMINNIKQALPQYGLACADIIYEVVAEGGITRLVAVMQDPSKADVIGSVRSTRSYYLDLAQGHDAILFHAGASEMAYADISKRGVDNADGTRGGKGINNLYYRDNWRKNNLGLEHSLMTTGQRVMDYLAQTSYRTEHKDGYEYPVLFEPDHELSGGENSKVTVKFSNYKTGVFDYDEETGTYRVSEYGAPHIDATTGDQLAMTNVLVLEAKITSIRGDAYGRMAVDLVSSGKGLYFCGGRSTEITWSKTAYTAPFTYTGADGEAQVFRSGTSYICIVSSLDNVTVK